MVGFWWQMNALFVLIIPIGVFTTINVNNTTKCKISEFTCTNRKCIPLNFYCNNLNDCGDSSDEPRYCTRCNRTYMGIVGKTYDLELHRPKEDKIPFICHLTFTAAGDEFGDLLQLTFDSFTLGRFVSFTLDGCPDGALQVSELNRPQVGGSWCGTSWGGPAIYYSETNSVTLYISLLRLSKDQSGYNFDYRMEYKFLKKKLATVRYGGGGPAFLINSTVPSISGFLSNQKQQQPITSEPEYFLGDLITGTYCSRIFSDCDRKHCRLQSPNFPGIYPRNLTCYYAVRQHEIPPGKHVLIIVRQPKGQLVSIRSQSILYGTASTKQLKLWNDCDDVQDYVTIYDGYTTRDPVIMKFCGGGEAIPEAISSGHELLVEFSTSPFGTFLHPSTSNSMQTTQLHGFQLEVEIKFIEQHSPSYVKNKRQCEFWLRGTNKGVLESPQHSLPANTTCLYHLQGIDTSINPSPIPFRPQSSSSARYPPDWRHAGMILPPPRYRVWLSIVKFHVVGTQNILQKPQTQEICRSYLNVWDGQLWTPTNCKDLYCSGRDKSKSRTSLSTSSGGSMKRNVTLLGRYCREHVPRSCDHSLLANITRFPRPCTLAESYLTSGDSLTLELKLADSTALRPVKFRALYEFVDLHLDGEPYGTGPCSRKFTTNSQDIPQKFKSPRDIFLYGRGGAKSISCVYRFEAQKDERIKIVINELVIKNRNCITRINKDTDRLECDGNTTATIRLFEIPWNDLPDSVSRDCLCSVDKNKLLPFTYISTSNIVELHFNVIDMNANDDFNTLSFEGNWKFIKTPICLKNLQMQGASGHIVFNYPSETTQDTNCENNPRIIIPSSHKYLYVKISGVIMKHYQRYNNSSLRTLTTSCGTTNRIKVHTALYTALICPYETSSRHHLVEVFSEGWTLSNNKNSIGQMTLDKIELDYLGKDLSRTIVLEFIGKEDGYYSIGWLEISRRRDIPPNGSGLFLIKPDECQYRCPELDACINSTVWCNGIDDCPSGIDEAITHCSILFQMPPIYLFFGFLGILISTFITFLLIWKNYCKKRPRSILQTRLKSLSSDTAIIDEKDVIC